MTMPNTLTHRALDLGAIERRMARQLRDGTATCYGMLQSTADAQLRKKYASLASEAEMLLASARARAEKDEDPSIFYNVQVHVRDLQKRVNETLGEKR
jgi:hypothetical protein